MLRVLAYHRIAWPADTPGLDPAIISATPVVFAQQMRHIRKHYRPVSLADMLDAWSGRVRLPRRAVHVTFDDAYSDFAQFAWPILKVLGIPVTVFVPTAYPSDPGRAFWWDRLHRASACLPANARSTRQRGLEVHRDLRKALRTLPHDEAETIVDGMCVSAGLSPVDRRRGSGVMDWDELRRLARDGVTFGAHTHNHVALPRVDAERARLEIRASLDFLQSELGDRPTALAYPYGSHDAQVARIASEEGCRLAFTCEDGLNDARRTDPMRLRRTGITRRTSPEVFAVRMLPWFANLDRLRHAVALRKMRM